MILSTPVLRKYTVCLYNYNDLSTFYNELETEGCSPPNSTILRAVECIARRPLNRQTGYLLTDDEADQLKHDSRVKFVELYPEEEGITISPAIKQYSNSWHKGSAIASGSRNWGLLRSAEGKSRLNWGRLKNESATGTINLQYTGKNVDVIICDSGSIQSDHIDFQQSDSQVSRVKYYNWFQHNPEVTGGEVGTYVTPTISSHSMHVAGIATGKLSGWAKDANIYTIPSSTPQVFDYIKEFHKNKPINPATGKKNPTIVNASWGYTSFSLNNRTGTPYVRAITYRGTRRQQFNLEVETPTPEYLQNTSGVCNETSLLAQLAGFENTGNKIRTSATHTYPASITSTSIKWKVSAANTDNAAYATINYQGAPRVLTINFTTHIPNAVIKAVNRGYGFSAVFVEFELVLIDAVSGNTINSEKSAATRATNTDVIGHSLASTFTIADPGNYILEYRNLSRNAAGTVKLVYAIGLFEADAIVSNMAASVEQIPNVLLGRANLIDCTTSDQFDEDQTVVDFYKFNRSDDVDESPLAIPFDSYLFNKPFQTYCIGSDFALTRNGTSVSMSNFGYTSLSIPKILLTSGRRSITGIFAGVEGGPAPNRTFRIRVEGHYKQDDADPANPTVIFEYTFYENDPYRIDLQIGRNDCVRLSVTNPRSFTFEECASANFPAGYGVPRRVASVDEDVKEAIDAGVIIVAAAGNTYYRVANPNDQDWDNTVELIYPAGSPTPRFQYVIKYSRGMSPGGPHAPSTDPNSIGPIVVGAIDSIYFDRKASYSFCGPGITVYAPGTYITSAVPRPSGTLTGSFLGKMSGTSMASPQVTGVLACILEKYPDMTHNQAREYIKSIASKNQIVDNPGGWGRDNRFFTDDLQGSDNAYLRYPFKQQTTGMMHPYNTNNMRPGKGVTYPRPPTKKK